VIWGTGLTKRAGQGKEALKEGEGHGRKNRVGNIVDHSKKWVGPRIKKGPRKAVLR